ncbi:TIGR02680 family protein [Mesorhizobium sp. MSK_1335]|uniref:TIGR02680 family protein n=1 Tax=Mesorhizobium montanum TaxID=3072323 RepID=A0ABU4ZFM8_9HYPH|nr:TIGR02680 family protein [Mesorhizobium sp. MSK_1335]MDX8524161.1 TIGR02680 family protein [Mesorhizobium sp. MSK_1335]
MNDSFIPFAAQPGKPTLPAPTRKRWQPLRLGLVELFHYDSEEFWFRDGHLLLRGNNGTGKSKVLSLTLPLLLDAQLKPSRVEPDGDGGKKMAWNLLMNSYDRRNGYAWVEFGRIAEDGLPRYLSLGVGLSATAARPQVDSWFFLIEDADDAPRINQDLWLTSAQRVVLTKERLRDALEGRGQVFDTAASYRRAVDERLFHLGTRRYDALMDTLIQLRQPQLSRKPDETALSNALTEALPPLAPELLGDVAEALGQLEEDRRQLDEYQALAKAVGHFDERYRAYAGTQTRRQARLLRQAQTEFDNASRARGEAQARLDEARAQEALARTAHDDAEISLTRGSARLDTLRSDPTMQDANRLEGAEREAAARRQAMQKAAQTVEEAGRRLGLATEETGRAALRMGQAERGLTDLRRESAGHADAAGIASQHAESPLAVSETSELVELTRHAFDRACVELRNLVAGRREQIALLRRRQTEVAQAEATYAQRRVIQDERQLDAEEATERRTQADAEVERQGRSQVESWDRHFTDLKQLQIDSDGRFAALTALAEWAVALQGDNPARHLLQSAHQKASLSLTQRQVALDGQRQALETERASLEDERGHLEAGGDIAPPLRYPRDASVREARQGAPFWQVVDFRDAVTAPQRAGLEAALEAAGLLDAWISPDGRLQTGHDGAPLFDVQVLERQNRPPSLADWLHATVPAGCNVPDDVVERTLSGIACADDDPIDGEAWIAPDGRFRLGALSGAWGKPTAIHVGHAARAVARTRRLAEIADRLAQLSAELAAAQAMTGQLALDREQADEELRRAPADEALRSAHLAAAACTREARLAGEKLAEADIKWREAKQALKAVREQLAADAADLRLPESPDALPLVEAALEHYRDAQVQLDQAAHELRLALPEWQRQRAREDEARGDLRQREEELATARIEAEDASARFDVLRETVGAKVEELQRHLADARIAVESGETALKLAREALRNKGEARAVANEQAETANIVLQQRGEARARTISKLQQFTGTGLLSAALPHVEMPDMGSVWTIDPALTLARRAEQELSGLKDDDETWARVQRQIAEELTELQRALGALGHQAQADPSDWGFSVNIIYQNRRERPDRLAMRLAEEIGQRSELLTANERAVLENHLQAEIAAEIQRLLQAAERQVDAINKELHKRPTSTGVRYRLVWQPLSEEEGAPVGLDMARKRLLNTSADLWSADDRSVVGAMLQQRISAERERADSIGGKDGGGTLLDQLARALDYRHWHRFRVERWQEGHWRKLSGPASSGERALGLTIPLFAAVASFYSQGSYALAPRLMLLDEAFAGIDDTARAHCMGLIREFDLDFVITSEREWACYAELPGVAICQLQRREGIDAVFVSRWTWDGREKTLEADPDRRFAPA